MEVESTELRVDTATEANAGVYACLAHAPSEAFSAAAVVQVEFYGTLVQLELTFLLVALSLHYCGDTVVSVFGT